jgi:lia operon protein LiaG
MSLRGRLAGARGAGLLLVLAGAGIAWGPAHADTIRYSIPGKEVTVYNLVGSLEILPGTGSAVTAEVQTQGQDAAKLKVLTGQVRGRQALRVVYPDDHVVVPSMGHHSTTTLRVREDGTFGDDKEGHDQGRRMTLSDRGPGIEASADVKLLVPPGTNLIVRWGLGSASVARVDAKVTVDGASMPIRAEDLHGPFHADIGSGSVDVMGSDAELNIDTGSGGVHLRDVRTRENILVDTGSGEVSGENLSAASVAIDTGSGSITLEKVEAKSVTLDTGSGEIDLDLTSDVSTLVVESGSGDVTVSFPRGVGAQLSVETGSGGIRSELALETQVRKHDALIGRIGDGRGTIEIETGSGTVTLRERKL